MAHRVCPWWIGYLLASPLRRLAQDPGVVVGPFVSEGMVVLEPGPGMGFFTLEMARRVGASGKVIAVDVQEKMIRGLVRRAKRAGLAERIVTRVIQGEGAGVDDLAGMVDFVLMYAMLHEVPNQARFLVEISKALKSGGKVLLAEPAGHVSEADFEVSLRLAAEAGLGVQSRPMARGSHNAVLVKG